jgi:hypothetical protein
MLCVSKMVGILIYWRTLNLEILGKIPFGCSPHVVSQKLLKGQRWWLPPSPNYGRSCEFVYAHGSSVHQKCSNYALTNLFGLCKLI